MFLDELQNITALVSEVSNLKVTIQSSCLCLCQIVYSRVTVQLCHEKTFNPK